MMSSVDGEGGGESYFKMRKGNLDVTGEYVIWTGKLGGDRLGLFMVRVPGHRFAP